MSGPAMTAVWLVYLQNVLVSLGATQGVVGWPVFRMYLFVQGLLRVLLAGLSSECICCSGAAEAMMLNVQYG